MKIIHCTFHFFFLTALIFFPVFSFAADPVLVDFHQESDPSGVLSLIGEAEVGAVTHTATAPAAWNNLRFYGWYDHAYFRYEEANGAAENPAQIFIVENTTMTAHYLDESADSDLDTIPDWYEWYYYGDMDEDTHSDTDGDGYSLYEEWSRNHDPHQVDELSYRVWEHSDPDDVFELSEVYVDETSNRYTTASHTGP